MSKELCFFIYLLKRDRMIYDNIGLVPFVFRKYFKNTCEIGMMEDLIQIGYLGLITAVDKFDESRGVKFSAFASLVIRQQMIRGIKSMTYALGYRFTPGVKIREHNALPLSYFETFDKHGEPVNVVENNYYGDEDVKLNDEVTRTYILYKSSLDERDQAILDRLEKNMIQRDIAKELDMKQRTVSYRKSKMQRELKALLY